MADPNTILTADLDKTTELQEELHGSSKSQIDQKEEVVVDSCFVIFPSYRTRCPQIPVVLEPKPSGEYQVYEIDSNIHFVNNLSVHQQLPEIAVLDKYKDRVQICWCPNPGLNVVESADMQADERVIQSFDSNTLNLYYRRYLPAEWNEEHVNLTIGNVPFLIEWSDHLPSFPLEVWQPWFYSSHRLSAFPMFRCTKSKIRHRYKYKRAITSMLRMRFRKSDNHDWVEIPPKMNLLKFESNDLPHPTMRAFYSKASAREIEQLFEYNDPMYVPQLLAIDSPDPVLEGTTKDFDINGNHPCVAIHILAENIEAMKKNNLSNYSTNASDIDAGWNPVKSAKVLSGNLERIPELPSHYMDRIVPLVFFHMKINQPGYNSICFGHDAVDPVSINTTTILSDKMKLSLKLGDTDPYANLQGSKKDVDIDDLDINMLEETSSTDSKKEYKIHIRLHIIKKIIFTDDRKCVVVTD